MLILRYILANFLKSQPFSTYYFLKNYEECLCQHGIKNWKINCQETQEVSCFSCNDGYKFDDNSDTCVAETSEKHIYDDISRALEGFTEEEVGSRELTPDEANKIEHLLDDLVKEETILDYEDDIGLVMLNCDQ